LSGKVLGRAAVEISRILRGKNDRNFIYNLDLGNHVVLINSDKVVLTGNKIATKKYYDHSGYPGGLRERTSGVMLTQYSVELVHRVIKGLMPHNSLSRKQLTRLFVYAGSNHPHKAQEEKFLVIQ
jgi:large subunit ribosomal protein L13